MTPLQLAGLFHDTYERLAPSFNYETRPETRDFRPASPNGQLMIAVCAEILDHYAALGCQHCNSRRPFYLVHDDNELGTLEICLDCGQIQGTWPFPEDA